MAGSLAYSLVLWLSLLQALLGLALIGVALYVFGSYTAFLVLIPVNTLYITVAVGVGLIVVSLMSCYGSADSRRGKSKCLYLAFALSLLCFVVQIASAVLFQQAAGLAVAQSDLVSGTLTNPTQVYYNNAVLSTYVVCCTGCGPECTRQVSQAANKGFCTASNGTFVCERAQVCTPGNLEHNGCVVGPVTEFPPQEIIKPVCDLLDSLSVNSAGVALVGNATLGGCGHGSPTQFTNNVFDFFGDRYNKALIGLGVLCALQGINTIAQLWMVLSVPGAKYGQKNLPVTTPTSPRAMNDW